jgi:hypothetical protein
VLLTQSKIKDNVDHAGPSPQLPLWRVLISLPLESFLSSLSNNSLIATPNHLDVTEVSKYMLSNMLRTMDLSSKLLTHTLVEPKSVKQLSPRNLLKLLAMLMFQTRV